MANDLVTTERSAALTTARLQSTVDSMYQSIERDRRGGDTLPALPSPAFRKELTDRKRALHVKLRPVSEAMAELETARKAIAGFLGGYLNIKTDNPAAVAAGYVAKLRDQPLFAILAALDDFENRRVVDHHDSNGNPVYFTIDHAPSVYRILDQVKKCAAGAQEERYKIGRILAITRVAGDLNISPEEQARVAAGMNNLAATMGRMMTAVRDSDRRKIGAEAQEARDRARGIIENARRRNRELDAASQDAQATG
jgi:hypothetical protein